MARSPWFVSLLLFLTFYSFALTGDGTFDIEKSPKNVSLSDDEFLTFNFYNREYEKVKFVKFYSGKGSDGYTTENNLAIKERLSKIMEKFDGEILEKEQEVYGKIPYRVKILFYDIKDSYKKRSLNYYAGYFDSKYEGNKDKIFIDVYPTMIVESFDDVVGVLAHEFQHLIHFYYDKDEERWLNEGMSEVSSFIMGAENYLHAKEYLENPYSSINSWDNSIYDYGKVYMFFRYLIYRKGIGILKKIVANPLNGMSSIIDVLGYENFVNFFKEYACAICINDEKNIKYSLLNFKKSAKAVKFSNSFDYDFSTNMLPFSFLKFEIYSKTLSNHIIDFFESDYKNIKVAIYYNDNFLGVYSPDKNGIFYTEEVFNKMDIIAVNSEFESIPFVLKIKEINPKFASLSNPYYFGNVFFALKGNIDEVRLNDKKEKLITDGKIFYFSDDVEIFGINNLRINFKYSDNNYESVYLLEASDL